MSASIEMECNSKSRLNATNRASILTRDLFNNWNVINERKLTKSFLYKLDTSEDVNADTLHLLLNNALNLEANSKYKTITTGELKKKSAFQIGIPDEDRNRTISVDFNYNKYVVTTKTSTYVLHIEIFAIPDINLSLSDIRHLRLDIIKMLGEAIIPIIERVKGDSEIIFTDNIKFIIITNGIN